MKRIRLFRREPDGSLLAWDSALGGWTVPVPGLVFVPKEGDQMITGENRTWVHESGGWVETGVPESEVEPAAKDRRAG